jgi:hypothetical protein
VKNRFQSLPFKCNLHHYIEELMRKVGLPMLFKGVVGLYKLDPVYP